MFDELAAYAMASYQIDSSLLFFQRKQNITSEFQRPDPRNRIAGGERAGSLPINPRHQNFLASPLFPNDIEIQFETFAPRL